MTRNAFVKIDPTPAALSFNGTAIREREEFLNLTDMWKAAGADDSKRPAEWLRQEATQGFIEYLRESLNMGSAHIDLVTTERGGRDPGTWAHWQAGMAYAKYLSPEFHAWCNEVVRAHMMGTLAPADPFAGLTERIASGIQAGIAPLVSRLDMVNDSVRRLTENHGALEQRVGSLEATLIERLSKRRIDVSPKTFKLHCIAVAQQGGLCPCCRRTTIVDPVSRLQLRDDEKRAVSECDHFHAASRAKPNETWLICRECHAKLTRSHESRAAVTAAFLAYQYHSRHILDASGKQGRLFQ